jgi:hypothetical protein
MEDEYSTEGIEPVVSLPLELDIWGKSLPDMLLLQLTRRVEGGSLPVAAAGASWGLLESKEIMQAWAARTVELFRADVQGFVLNGLALLLHEASSRALVEAGIVPYDNRGILRFSLDMTERLARERLKMEAGRPSKWNSLDLSQAIADAMAELADGQCTYNKVAEKMRKKYGDRAPKSGESLRKMVRLLEVDWMRIKREAKGKRKRS